MKHLSAYLKLVDNDYDGDGWYDVLCLDAQNLASQFDNSEWDALTKLVGSMPPVSQEKCLYTISDAHPINAFRIGLLILRLEDIEGTDVFYRALEIMTECIEFMRVEQNDLTALNELKQTISDTPAAERFHDAIQEKITSLSK